MAAVALLSAAALAVRLQAIAWAAGLPFLDKYPAAAERWLAGALDGERLLDFSPFYLALTSFVSRAGGALPPALLLVQAAAGALAVPLAYALAHRWSGRAGAVAAGAAVAFSEMAVLGGALLEPEVWLGLLLLAATWAIGRQGRGIGAGLLAGAAALVRPTALLAPLGWSALVPRRRGALALATAGGLAAAGLALWLAGRVPLGSWPALMSPGQVLHQGNGPGASGFGLAYPPAVGVATAAFGPGEPDYEHQAYRLVARAATGDCLSPPAAEGYWRALALAEVRRDPGRAAARAAGRLAGALHRRQVWDVAGAARLERRVALLAPVGIAALLPLALVGFLLPGGRRMLPLLPPLLVPLATVTLFVASGRHRVPLDLLLAPAAGVGVAGLFAWGRGRLWVRGGRALVVALGAGLGLLAALWPPAALTAARQGGVAWEEGQRLARQARSAGEAGDLERERELAAAAVVTHPAMRELLPVRVLDSRAFADAVARSARQRLAAGQGLAAAATAAVEVAGDCRLVEAAAGERPRRQELALLAARCALRRRDPAAAGRWLAPLEPLPLAGHAAAVAARVLAGADLGPALATVPPRWDPLSVLVAVAVALEDAGLEGERREIEAVVRQRLARARRCHP
ncbi:MAG TPA: hypothetical protein VMT16_15385 [Thermoanaerobaculia bacterium]|nr:hypothetical protein [Thermoanaerobaculia bacterium]